jgi:Protein of unknown function (DUF2798)
MLLRIPKKYGYSIFGIIQSGITCAVATGIACLPTKAVTYWATSWLLSWATMTPVVLLAAPLIRRVIDRVTFDE